MSLTRMLRANCLVAVDAVADPALNYHVTVLGFPTIARLRHAEPPEVYRKGGTNRSTTALLDWMLASGASAPIGDASGAVASDSEWLGRYKWDEKDKWKGGVINVTTDRREELNRVNWPLMAANVVCLAHALRMVFVALAVHARRKRRVRVEAEAEEEDERQGRAGIGHHHED